MAGPGWESRGAAESFARELLGELYEPARTALGPVVLRLDSRGALRQLAACLALVERLERTSKRVQLSGRPVPPSPKESPPLTRGLVVGDDGWASWRSEFYAATQAVIALSEQWRRRTAPEEWAVGPASPSTSRRVNGAAALAQLSVPWTERHLPGLAALAIETGLEQPCRTEAQWRQRLAGWKKALLQRAAGGRTSR